MNDIENIIDDFVIQFKQRLLEEASGSNKVYFLDYAWKWFDIYKLPKEKNTQFMYKNIINTHLSFLEGVYLSDIRQSHVQEAINHNLSKSRTCELIYLTFKQILQAASRDRLISKNTVDDIIYGVTLPKKVKKEKRGLTDLERAAVHKVEMDPMKETFLFLLYYTGIRKGEALALTPEDFNFVDNTVKITKNLVFLDNTHSEIKDHPKSDNGFRKIPLPAKCIKRIKGYISSCKGYLFHGSGQGVVLATKNFYRRFWESILFHLNVAAGYDPYNNKEKLINGLTAHIFRHDYCTQLCYQIPEISTKMIAHLLGDNEKMVIEVYSHILLEKENVIESIERAR